MNPEVLKRFSEYLLLEGNGLKDLEKSQTIRADDFLLMKTAVSAEVMLALSRAVRKLSEIQKRQ